MIGYNFFALLMEYIYSIPVILINTLVKGKKGNHSFTWDSINN